MSFPYRGQDTMLHIHSRCYVNMHVLAQRRRASALTAGSKQQVDSVLCLYLFSRRLLTQALPISAPALH